MPIPTKSIKQRIMERVATILEPLKGEQGFRSIRRTRSLFQLESLRPALHIVAGPEVVIDEDNRGLQVEFGLFLKLMVAEAREIDDAVDRLVWKIQEKIENDEQLSGGDPATTLAIKVEYDGEQPFSEEILKPEGGTVVAYVIRYRRYLAEPKSNY